LAKKAARKSVAIGMWASGGIELQKRFGKGPLVRALTYHRFGEAERDPWCVSSRVFDTQMRWLAARGLAVSLDDVLGFARGERELPNGAVLVTMDDGYSSVYTHALPTLREYNIPAVVYVTTSVVGTKPPAAPERYLSWDEVGQLHEAGITIGSHAHTHRSLGKMPLAEARSEGTRSREMLEAHLGAEIRSFAYPFGMRRDHSPQTAEVLGQSGYTSVFIAEHGTIAHGSDVLSLPRIKVEGGEGTWMFKLQCRGALDVWQYLDRAIWPLQRPHD
jgi:peptidoglycan/xylan/chitin deacetylase (PgdA/CDA1 family)